MQELKDQNRSHHEGHREHRGMQDLDEKRSKQVSPQNAQRTRRNAGVGEDQNRSHHRERREHEGMALLGKAKVKRKK
ncbi:MAG TPA: hypothetical protein VEF34_03165 [Syntrophobacteraceae bacterium]|nr:hypothetical protein [Syntrophobacteraceae bacterium]